MRAINLTGLRFWRLVVIAFAEQRRLGNGIMRRFWLCQCDCGNMVTVMHGGLSSGNSESCGCLHKERASAASKTHGLSGTAEYKIWASMIKRCTNPRDDAYKHYGQRGITVCDRWLNSFEMFITDMRRRPTSNHSIERIDNNKGYEPGNCMWATGDVQQNNKRTNHRVTFNGETRTLKQWAEHTGIPYSVLRDRCGRLGWEPSIALTRPVRRLHGNLS